MCIYINVFQMCQLLSSIFNIYNIFQIFHHFSVVVVVKIIRLGEKLRLHGRRHQPTLNPSPCLFPRHCRTSKTSSASTPPKFPPEKASPPPNSLLRRPDAGSGPPASCRRQPWCRGRRCSEVLPGTARLFSWSDTCTAAIQFVLYFASLGEFEILNRFGLVRLHERTRPGSQSVL